MRDVCLFESLLAAKRKDTRLDVRDPAHMRWVKLISIPANVEIVVSWNSVQSHHVERRMSKQGLGLLWGEGRVEHGTAR